MRIVIRLLLMLLVLSGGYACMSPKKALFAYDLQPGTDTAAVAKYSSEQRIQVADLLQVQVQGLDPSVMAEFNVVNAAAGNLAGAAGGRGIGQRVSEKGTIVVPRVGEVPVLGLTVEEAAERIRIEVAKWVKEPTVLVSALNFRVSVLGAVRSPGSYNNMTDRMTILDALAQAGDVQLSGLRDRVWVIREQNGLRQYEKVNLNSSSLFDSEFYYMRNNDIVYVQPNALSAFAGSNAALFSVLGATLGIVALIISIAN